MKLKPQKMLYFQKIVMRVRKMFLLSMLIMIKLTQQIEISNIDIQNSTISTLTSYTFLLQRNDNSLIIPQGSYLQIIFPPQYVNRITFTNGSNVTCSSVELTTAQMYCGFFDNALKVYNGFETGSSIKRFFLTVNNILNPFPAKVYDPFIVSIHYTNDTVFQQGFLPAQITTNSGKSLCSITNYANNFVYSRGSILISYQSQFITTFNSSYKLLLSMNTSYANDPLSTSISPQITGYSVIGISGSFKFTVNYSTTVNVSLIFPPSTMRVNDLIYMEAYVENLGSVDWCYVSLIDIIESPMQVNIVAQPSTVQELSTYTFTMDPIVAIFSTDSLLIQFPTSYNLSSLTSTTTTFFLGIFSTKSFQLSGQIINITSLIPTYIISKTIKFNMTNLMNPFSSGSVNVKLTVLTNDGYLRSKGSHNLLINPGIMKINMFTCATYQVGYKSSCKLNFTTTSSILLNSQIRLTFPTQNWMTSYSGSNTKCQVVSSSPQIKSIFQCRYQQNIKSLVLTQFTDLLNITMLSPFTATVSIEQSSIDIDHRILLPWNIDTFKLSLESYTVDNFLIDTGTFSLTTVKRELFKTDNNSIMFSSLTTMTMTEIIVTYELPNVDGGSYNMRLYLPLQMTGAFSDIRTTYGTVIGFDILTSLLTIRLTDITASSNNLTITGFKNYPSTKPVTYTIQILSHQTVYYFFTTVLSVPEPKKFSTLTINQDSQTVYQQNNLSITVSQLQNGDIMTYYTMDYTEFQSVNTSQNWCSPTVIVNCNVDGSITIASSNNADQLLKLTQFNFIIKNSPFVGKSTFVVTVYDESKLYVKQNGSFMVNVQQMNFINPNSLTYTSSNPYFSEPTTLTLTLILTTPGANTLTITFPTTYQISSSKCIKNCQLPTINPSNNMFVAQLDGQDVSVQFQVVNPMNFTEKIAIISKDLIDRNIDFGQVILVSKCQIPCRSCSANNQTQCTSCYNFSINKTLSSSMCQSICPDGQYQITQSSMFYCLTCPSSCTKCTSNTTCQQCKTSFIYLNSTCVSNCPNGYFLAIDNVTEVQQCLACTSSCKLCSSTAANCTECITGLYLFQNSCLANCPNYYYKTITGRCSQCPAICLQCQDTTGYCNFCVSSFYLYENNCYSQCPIAGYAKNSTSGKCQECTLTCSTCGQFIDQCLYCRLGYFLMNGVCLNNCPDGYYNNAGTRKCQLCQSPCIKCSGSGNYCESCVAGRFFYNNQCYQQCPNGSYQSVNSTVLQCVACPWPCTKCADIQTCSQCSPPYALNISSCVLNCGLGNFINSVNQCQKCDLKCKTCNITGCIECSNPLDFLSTQLCVQSCSPQFKNQLTMKCQQCQQPCATCSTNSTTCTQCLPTYFLMTSESKCYLTCPPRYFSQNSYCKLCQQRNINCKQCNIDNITKSFLCSTCQQGAYFYGYVCIDKCPEDTTTSKQICMSSNCTQVQNCQLCSDIKCISCKPLYTLQNNVCQFRVVSAISNLKAPFPFLILVVCTILSSIALKVYFQKMYIPLYLYAFCGIFEISCMALWTGLSVMTSRVNLQQQPINFYFATLLILIIYVTINILSFVLKYIILDKDKKFTNWQRQDNKSASIFISLISFAVSFRFQLLMFSKLGNRQSFSAYVGDKQKFFYLMIINLASIFLISIPTICLACYLIYLQQQMNYLFFTCIEIATISLIMIVLVILAYLTPIDYVLEKKDQYKKGYIEENFVQGKSLAGLLCVEEEYYEEASVVTIQNNDGRKIISEDEISSLKNDGMDNIGFIDTKLSAQALEMNIDQYADSMQHIILTKNNQYNTNKSNFISSTSIQTRPQQSQLQQQNCFQISQLLQKALIRKQQILKKLVQQENEEIMKEINGNFGIKQQNDGQEQSMNVIGLGNKRVGRIVRQLYNRYDTYGKDDDDNSQIGEQLSEQDFDDDQDKDKTEDYYEQHTSQQQQKQQQQMHSSQLLKQKTTRRLKRQKINNKQTILTNHQTLSLTQQDNFVKQTIKKQTIQQNLKNIEKIKILLQQLTKQQRQQQQLKIKLFKLNNDLSSQQYLKLKQKIQHDNMTLEDKLSRLNQMYYQKKYQRDNKKINNKINQNSNFSLNVNQIQNNLNPNFNYQGQEINIQQILPKKVKVQSAKKKLLKNANNIELKTKNQCKIDKKQSVQNKTVDIKKNIQRKKLYRASLTNRVKMSNKLQPINEQDRKSSDTFLYVPMLSQRTNQQPLENQPQIIKVNPILPQKILNEKKRISFLNQDIEKQLYEEEHKSNTSWIEQQNLVQKTSPLIFTQPLKQDQPNQVQDLQQQNVKYEIGDQIDKDRLKQEIQLQKLSQKQKQNKIPKIQYHQDPIETVNQDFEHWPIEPQLEQRINQVEKLAQSYLKSKKNPKNKLSKYASATLHQYHLPNQKEIQFRGSQSKFTQVNYQKTDIISKDNSIFNAARQSQIQLNYPQGQMLVFQDDEDIIDEILQTEEKSFQRNKMFKQTKVIELNLESNNKIPKRRANRSVINLSPGKY